MNSAREDIWEALRAGAPDRAKTLAQEWTNEAPEDAEAWRLLGESLLQLGSWDEAAEPLRRSVALDPHFAGHYGLGLISHQNLAFADAREHYRSALEYGVPESLEACENIVIAFAASGDRRGAKYVAGAIGQRRPEFEDSLNRFASCIRGYNPSGSMMDQAAVLPLHDCVLDTQRKQIESTRAFLRRHGKRSGLRGLLGR